MTNRYLMPYNFIGKRKGLSVAGLGLLTIIIFLVIAQVGNNTRPFCKIALAAGTPDAYGNQIHLVSFWNNSTGTWLESSGITSDAYYTGITVSIPANESTIVYCQVMLNSTLADNVTQAASYTRIILTVWNVTTELMTQGNAALLGSYYFVEFSWPSTTAAPTEVWTPVADTTYSLTFEYQAFFET